MSRYLNTLGKTILSVGVCDRCKMKRPLADFIPDPNALGLRVCGPECADKFDPYRLPARQTEPITPQYPRPEDPIEAPE